MTDIHAARSIRKRLRALSGAPRYYWAITGDGQGNVKVPGEKNMIYVRVGARKVLMKIRNFTVGLSHGMPIDIMDDPQIPGKYMVRGLRFLDGVDYPEGAAVAFHEHTEGGTSPAYITQSQILDLLTVPATGTKLSVYGGYIINGNGYRYVYSATLDMSSHIPVSGARWVLIYADADGIIQTSDGTVGVLVDLITATIPVPPTEAIGIAAVKCYAGQTSFSMSVDNRDIIPLSKSPAPVSDKISQMTDVTLTGLSDGDALTWDSGTSKWVNAASGTATVTQTVYLTVEGAVSVTANPLRLYNASGASRTISKVFLSANTAPTGANIIVDIHKDGTTIFTNQAHRPVIVASANTGYSTSIDVATWADGSYLTMEVDQVGSTVAGSYLTVHIIFS